MAYLDETLINRFPSTKFGWSDVAEGRLAKVEAGVIELGERMGRIEGRLEELSKRIDNINHSLSQRIGDVSNGLSKRIDDVNYNLSKRMDDLYKNRNRLVYRYYYTYGLPHRYISAPA